MKVVTFTCRWCDEDVTFEAENFAVYKVACHVCGCPTFHCGSERSFPDRIPSQLSLIKNYEK